MTKSWSGNPAGMWGRGRAWPAWGADEDSRQAVEAVALQHQALGALRGGRPGASLDQEPGQWQHSVLTGLKWDLNFPGSSHCPCTGPPEKGSPSGLALSGSC